MDKTTKALIGIGSLVGLSYLALSSKDKQNEYGTGGFGGAGGFDTGLAGESASDGSGSPAGMTFNFPTPDTSVLASFLGDSPEYEAPQTLQTKKEMITSPAPPVTTEAAKNTVTSSLLGISPKSIKSDSTLTAISGSNLSPEAKSDLLGYVGTPANVVDEQFKKVKEAAGINLISQKGNEFSEYTPAEKARSKPEANIFQKMIGAVISPVVEEPRAATAGKNIIAPVYENVISDKKSWQGGTVKSGGFGSEKVKVVPSGGSQDLTEQLQSRQLTKKEAAGQAAVKILESGAGKSLLPYTPSSSSKKGTGSATVVKKAASEPAKKSWTLAEVKAGKNRR